MNKQKIIFLKGLPGSGKTTWAKEYIANNPNAIRVNKDEIRIFLHNRVFSRRNEEEVLDYQDNAVIVGLANGNDVVIDNTHLSGTHEEDFRNLAKNFRVDFEIKSFLDVPIETCLERNSKREGNERVPDEVIISMGKKIGVLPKSPTEFEKVNNNKSLFPCIIVDIDGTIAKMDGRSPYDYSRVHTDKVHWDVVKLIEYYLYGYENELGVKPTLIIVSGRNSECRQQTIDWLTSNKIYFDQLRMRETNDKRKDSIVKYEILQDIIKEYYVDCVFDDRNQVVKMWREAGLRCYQVADGNF